MKTKRKTKNAFFIEVCHTDGNKQTTLFFGKITKRQYTDTATALQETHAHTHEQKEQAKDKDGNKIIIFKNSFTSGNEVINLYFRKVFYN